MNSASLRSLAGRYDNPIPHRFLAPIDFLKIPALIFPITRVHCEGEEKSFKLLGVLFDEYLSFEAHITSLCNKISLYCLNRIKNFVTPTAMKMLYFAMVHSHIVYCLNVFSCANITTILPLKLKGAQA
jgi:hypothetical protein